MDKIEMIHTGGPYGDCCSSYHFRLNREMTFDDFVNLIIETFPREWGDIRGGRVWGPVLCEYKHGRIVYLDVSVIGKTIKTEGMAHGGWSRMDYVVDFKK